MLTNRFDVLFADLFAQHSYEDLALVADFLTDVLGKDWHLSVHELRRGLSRELERRDVEQCLSADGYGC